MSTPIKYGEDIAFQIKNLHDQGMSRYRIGEKLGIPQSSVQRVMKRYGIEEKNSEQ